MSATTVTAPAGTAPAGTAPAGTGAANGVSRRGLLAGGLAGAGALAITACAADPSDVSVSGGVWVARVGRAPIEPADAAWDRAAPTIVDMDVQVMVLPHRPAPLVAQIAVRALHDGETISFRLDWDDPDTHDLTVRVDDFRDACAVLLAGGEGDQGLRTMGSVDQPATLLHWKADWQRDMDLGVQGAADVYPNRSIDVYPPLISDAPRDLTPADYEAAGATEWLPGLHVGNPLSASTRTACVEKLTARGFGTATTATKQNVAGRGERTSSGWRVVLAKPLRGIEADEFTLTPGHAHTCAFALWSGADQDAGGRKTPSKAALRLLLEF
ncbi:MAG: ethylbenzene dehydrogenase-related protein [Actinomycetota bacterium]